jgi:nucleoside-diphosphate-sugar epimerase
MNSNFIGPVNIGSEEMVTINELVDIVSKISNKSVSKKHILNAPLGVRGRNSDNTLIRENLSWDYKMSLAEGIKLTYGWIESELRKIKNQDAALLNL